MAPLQEAERREIWEVFDDRYQTRSTILTSQLPVARWHEQIGDPTINAFRLTAEITVRFHRNPQLGQASSRNRLEKDNFPKVRLGPNSPSGRNLRQSGAPRSFVNRTEEAE
jgi:hypothetical protein